MSELLPQPLATALEKRGAIPFSQFCRIALYDENDGYYQKEKLRVGSSIEADFTTNLSVQSTFVPLVFESVCSLLGRTDVSDYHFIEVGAEPNQSSFKGLAPNFAEVSSIGVSDSFPSLTGKVVLFANEWLDAQPFVRLVFTNGEWREVFVERLKEGGLVEKLYQVQSKDGLSLEARLPREMPEGYRVDLSMEVAGVLGEYLKQPWEGLFLTFDYGSSWESLIRQMPDGSGRAYRKQRLSTNLLDDPGESDLTCNVCWDDVKESLELEGFTVDGPERQESFFLNHASQRVRAIIEGKDDPDGGSKRRLMQILHPANFGAAFQVLWGLR
ncbi:MAG: SAM-dependent methyltransferase [Verrucomicrobiota bacterium]